MQKQCFKNTIVFYIFGIKISFKYYKKPSSNKLLSCFEIKRCLEFKEQLSQLDLKNNYKYLIKNLDDESINTVSTVLSRVSKIEPQYEYLKEDIFSLRELEIINTIDADLKEKIVKLSDDCYAYKNYYLPISYFDSSVFYYKYDLRLLKRLENIKSKCIIDAGAFVGDSALILEPYCDKVYAFEPTTSNYDLLLKTIDLNKKNEKIIPVKKGLGAKEEILDIHIARGCSSINRVLRDNLKTEPVEITTLDKFVEENDLQVGLIKVDIEGAEQDFLKGALNTIKTQKPILLISIYHSAFDFFQIKPYIESLDLGYDLKISKNTDGSIRGEILLIAQ
ncbi:FkbM family methyltransferase [bacterium]|nr:FkbM family methyltransferase [bacterium]